MAGRVDQVQVVGLAVCGPVLDPHRLRLDRDPALALEVHRVEQLRLHFLRVDGAGELEDAVGQRRLAVVDVGDDREVADVVHGRRSGDDGRIRGRGGRAGPVAAGDPPPPRTPRWRSPLPRHPPGGAGLPGQLHAEGSSGSVSLKTTVGGFFRMASAPAPSVQRRLRGVRWACRVRCGRGWRLRSRSRRRSSSWRHPAVRGRPRSRRGAVRRRRTGRGWRGRCRTAGTGACWWWRSARRRRPGPRRRPR